MRAIATGLALLVIVTGCEPEVRCGRDVEGERRPVCAYPVDVDTTVSYCPGQQWGASDGCNSCSCDASGVIVCTQLTCEGAESAP